MTDGAPRPAAHALAACDLSLGYGADPVLRGLDLAVPDGRVTAILGPNGCGKSTLLHALARVLSPDGGAVPDNVVKDRRDHFRTLRDTLKEWQAGGLDGAGESWAQYTARVEAARQHATRPGANCVLAVSSGGTIGRLVAQTIQAPDDVMITLNLQIKNTSITRFIFNDKGRFFLHEFNATPHFNDVAAAAHLTYS